MLVDMIALEHLTTPHSIDLFRLIATKHLSFAPSEIKEIATVIREMALKSYDGTVSLNVRNIERFRYVLVHMERCGHNYMKTFDDKVFWLAERLDVADISGMPESVHAEKTEDGWCLVVKPEKRK